MPNSILVSIVCLVSLAEMEVMGVVVSLSNLSQPDEGKSWKSFTVLILFGALCVCKRTFQEQKNGGTLDVLAPGDCSLDLSRTRDYCHRTPSVDRS